jgi:NodT family efflux transporter outer membrane factor (OMF) lipoprotein
VRIGALALAALVTGCVSGPNFETPKAPDTDSYAMDGDLAAPDTIRLAPSADAPTEWWTSLKSEAIDAVVAEAMANNFTLARADAALEAARAQLDATRGEAWPQVDADASAARSRINTTAFGITGFPSPLVSLYSLGANVGFDLDLFGGRRRAVERDEARAAAAQARVDAAYLTLSGNVVQQAVLIAGLRGKVAAQVEIVAGDEHMRDMVRRAIAAGGQAPAMSTSIEAQLAEDQAAMAPLQQQLAVSRHRLALLVGRTPAQWRAPDFALDEIQAPADIPVAVPSQLIRRRPDIIVAEAELHAAALFPNLSLNASLAQTSVEPERIFEATAAGWSVGASATTPIFHGGTGRANVAAANANQRAALAAYQQTVLEAIVQVSDLMQAIRADAEAMEAQQRALAAATRNASNAQVRYDNGAGTLLALVDAQRQANRARLSVIDAETRYYQDIAALYVATAADWRKA